MDLDQAIDEIVARKLREQADLLAQHDELRGAKAKFAKRHAKIGTYNPGDGGIWGSRDVYWHRGSDGAITQVTRNSTGAVYVDTYGADRAQRRFIGQFPNHCAVTVTTARNTYKFTKRERAKFLRDRGI